MAKPTISKVIQSTKESEPQNTVEQEAAGRGAGSNSEEISLANKSSSALTRSEAEKLPSHSPTEKFSGSHSAGVESPSECPPAPSGSTLPPKREN